MPKRSWIIATLLGLTFLTFVMVGSAYHLGSRLGEIRGERNYNARNYESFATDEITNTCLNGYGGDVAECISRIIEATNEQQRAENDLVVQTEMSAWAFWMLIASVATTIITLVGVVFVWLTLKETAAGISIMRSEQRPWLEPSYSDHVTVYESEDAFDFGVKMTTKNHGVAPAVQINVHVLVFRRHEMNVEKASDMLISRDPPEQHGPQNAIFPGESRVDEIKCTYAKSLVHGRSDGMLGILVGVFYSSIVGGQRHCTISYFHGNRRAPGNNGALYVHTLHPGDGVKLAKIT